MGATASTTSKTNPTGTTSGSSNSSIQSKTFSGLGNLIKLLPTGTVFLYQFLNPVVSNNGNCHNSNKILTAILLCVCGFNCLFASFTDSYTGSDGQTHYGIVTTNGLWPSSASDNVDLSSYKLRFGDFVHALFALLVFAVLGLLDTNTVECFYPQLDSNVENTLIMVLPPVIGFLSGVLFMLFPNTRHGIGYPASTSSTSTSNSA